ncbi:MAG: fatty acid--CoA ligase [Bacteroidetes bacterium]|nr:fatty acid--CoA ligase [Bacteroidota bacterium]
MKNDVSYGYEYPLLIKKLLTRSLQWNPEQKIIYRDIFEYTYADFYKRIKKLANLLTSLDIKKGDIVAVMDWDSHRYLEHYFAVPMIGAILHTINIRLSPEQMLYTINHAEDKILIVHEDFFPTVNIMYQKFESVKKIIVINDSGKLPESKFEFTGEYEKLLHDQSDTFDFPDFDENTIATTFYTTGTTGNPKGVYFTHRQLVLHTISGMANLNAFTDPVSFTCNDVYLPLTPMFHVHAWGVPYMATAMGVKQIYPGRYEPEMLLKLLLKHKVTFSHCVPTILQMILSSSETKDINFNNWKVIIGGAALSKGLAQKAMERNIKLTTGYGMSETCPILTIAQLKDYMLDYDQEEKVDVVTRTGFPILFVEMKVVDSNGNELPRGKDHVGEIIVRSPWLTQGYLKLKAQSEILWKDGWLHTGDIAYRDEEGYFKITDRLKDVIKTGGEWISSLELESIISQCEKVAEVAVIGVPDEKWGERPVAYIVPKPECKEKIIVDNCSEIFMALVKTGNIEKWAIPDKFIIVEQIPKTSVGKNDKKVLRAQYQKENNLE